MAYSDFTTLRKVKQILGLPHTLTTLFSQPITEVKPSEHLLFDIKEAEILAPVTEKSKSELIIEKQLTGICDFIFGHAPQTLEINVPVFCVIEAKNRTLEEGFGQCAAEMFAAKTYNTQDEQAATTIYGAVTNGYEWAFLELADDNLLKIDTDRYTILKLPQLLGVFQTVVDRL
jgi:hypothetical protein